GGASAGQGGARSALQVEGAGAKQSWLGPVQGGSAREGHRRDPRRVGGRAQVLPGMAAAGDDLFRAGQAGRGEQVVRALCRGVPRRGRRASAPGEGARTAAAGEGGAARVRTLRNREG